MDLINTLLGPLEWLVSWVLVAWHSFFSTIGLNPDGGAAWSLSIVGLVVVIRIILIPLFVKQIKAQRGLQILQPKIKELQKKYKDDRQKQSEEMMKLYKETGTNPFASCLPILLQSPIFFALFRVLNGIAHDQALGVFKDNPDLVQSMHDATIFGAPIYATFTNASSIPGVDPLNVKIVTLILIALMTLTTFTTQRQLMVKNMPADAPMAQQQKILLYVFPLMFAIFGINFPIGVLIYWLTTNLWSMGQQFYVIRNMPSPGTPAFKAHAERQAAKAAQGGSLWDRIVKVFRPGTAPDGPATAVNGTTGPDGSDPTTNGAAAKPPQRSQPKAKSRSQRSGKR